MKRFAYSLLLLLPVALQAQQDPQFSMYMFNRMVTTPQSAGSRGAINLTAVGRTQWVGIDGHPNTFTLSADAPIDALHGGVGAHFVYDQIGPIQTIGLVPTYAFRFNFGGREQGSGPGLQIGISPELWQKQIDGTNFVATENPAFDPVLRDLVGTTGSGFSFDLGAGIWFDLPNDRFYAGISASHLLNSRLNVEGLPEDSDTRLPRTITATTGYRFGRPGGPVAVTPSVLFRLADTQFQMEANVNVEISPIIFGLSFRAFDINELVGIVAFKANQRFMLGYSYDYPLSGLNGLTSGSHEILLSYTFPRFIRFYPPDLDTMDNPTLR